MGWKERNSDPNPQNGHDYCLDSLLTVIKYLKCAKECVVFFMLIISLNYPNITLGELQVPFAF